MTKQQLRNLLEYLESKDIDYAKSVLSKHLWRARQEKRHAVANALNYCLRHLPECDYETVIDFLDRESAREHRKHNYVVSAAITDVANHLRTRVAPVPEFAALPEI